MNSFGRKLSRSEFLKLGGAGAAGVAVASTPAVALAQSYTYIDYQEHVPGNFSGDTFTSKAIDTSISYDTLIPSWDAALPSGSSVTMQARVRYGGVWSGWMSLGRYSATGESRSASTKLQDWLVDIDTIQSRAGQRANAYQYRLKVSGSPKVRKVALVASQSSRHGESINIGKLTSVWGKSLSLPKRSQYDYQQGAAWCSPTSVNMVLGFNGRSESVSNTAQGVYDAGAQLWGNWPYNTGYASSRGLAGSVSRFNSIQQVERWIASGIPVVTSMAWDNRYSGRRLENASIPRATYGHLMIVVGFTKNGDVVVNDPAGSPRSEVRRVYDRGQFSRAWLDSDRWRGGRSDGVVYLIHPQTKARPGSFSANGSW